MKYLNRLTIQQLFLLIFVFFFFFSSDSKLVLAGTATNLADATWGAASSSVGNGTRHFPNYLQDRDGETYPHGVINAVGKITGVDWQGFAYDSYDNPSKRGRYNYDKTLNIGSMWQTFRGQFVIVRRGTGAISMDSWREGSPAAAPRIERNENTNVANRIRITYSGRDGTNYPTTDVKPTTVGKYTVTMTVPDDKDLYLVGYTASANFEIYSNNYTISYNANTGQGSMGDQVATYGTNINLTKNSFIRPGYFFDGWNTSADGSGLKYADGAQVSQIPIDIKDQLQDPTAFNTNKVTLFAQWKPRRILFSGPTNIFFGNPVVSKGVNYYPVNDVQGGPLVVNDERGIGSKWQLTAKLQVPLTHVNGKTLPESIIYKTNNGESILNTAGAQIIYSNTTTKDIEETDISKMWNNNSGLFLKIREGEALAGAYTSTIEWILNDAPSN